MAAILFSQPYLRGTAQSVHELCCCWPLEWAVPRKCGRGTSGAAITFRSLSSRRWAFFCEFSRALQWELLFESGRKWTRGCPT